MLTCAIKLLLFFLVAGLNCMHFPENGRGAFWCESAYPDALKKNACKIKEIATKNNFDVNDLQVADNCNCPNIPFAYTSACEKVSIEDYFCGC